MVAEAGNGARDARRSQGLADTLSGIDSLGTSVFGSCKKMDKVVQNYKLNECIIYIQGNTVTARYRYATS